jgi:hypothetical protein
MLDFYRFASSFIPDAPNSFGHHVHVKTLS